MRSIIEVMRKLQDLSSRDTGVDMIKQDARFIRQLSMTVKHQQFQLDLLLEREAFSRAHFGQTSIGSDYQYPERSK